MAAKYDHLVLISLDTLRSDCVGLHPCPMWPRKYPALSAPDTRVLDEIARGGVYFSNCISAAPYTSASHATFFTGKWPLRHGVYEFFNRKLDSRTVFSMAKDAGYRTLFKVDFPIILGKFLGFDRDVDEYIVEDDERLLQELRASERTASFVHFGGIHIPYGFHNLHYGGDSYRRRVAALEAEIPNLGKLPADSLVETYRDPEDTELLVRYKRIVEHHYTSGSYDKLFSLYLEGIEHFLQSRFRRFWERLLESLEGKRYLVVVFGDHGEEYDQDSYGHFNSLSDGVLQVPVIFYGSDVSPSVQSRRMRSIDIAPTLVDMGGLPAHEREDMNGVSLAGTVREGAAYAERTAIAQTYTSHVEEFVKYQQEMLETGDKKGELQHFLYKEVVHDGPFKLVRQLHDYAEHGGKYVPCPPRLSLHRQTRSGSWREMSNIDVEKQLAAILDAYQRTRSRAPSIGEPPAEIRRQLEDMGYQV